ncbi:MAG: hypothetical protein WC980_10070 [Candidatus Brocadiia bacterium]
MNKNIIKVALCLVLGAGLFIALSRVPVLSEDKKQAEPEAQEPEAEPAKGGDQPAQKVLDNMTYSRKADYSTMSRLIQEDVVLLGCRDDDPEGYEDQVQEVMKALSISYTGVTRQELETYNFSKTAALLCNCSEQGVSQKAADNIKTFLAKGGYLFATDWAIDGVIRKVAPGSLKSLGMGSQQGKQMTMVSPFEKNKEHLFLRGVFPKDKPSLQWMLDQGFKYYSAEKPENVTVLIVGDEKMKKEYRTDLVVVCWIYNGKGGYNPKFNEEQQSKTGDYLTKRAKQGVIMYVNSHFYMQKVGLKDVQGNSSMYQLIANFLIDAKLAKNARLQKK